MAEIRLSARPGVKPTSMSSGDTKMVAKLKDGSFGLCLCVPGPGDPVMGAHSARSHRTKCAMASKTMKFELVGRRRDAPTASSPGANRVSPPPSPRRLPESSRGKGRNLRVHRGVLQSATSPLDPRLPDTSRLRADGTGSLTNLSTKPGQSHHVGLEESRERLPVERHPAHHRERRER